MLRLVHLDGAIHLHPVALGSIDGVMLQPKEVKELFPEAVIVFERFLEIPNSIIAVYKDESADRSQ